MKDTQQIDLEKIPETKTVVSVVNGIPPMAFKELEQTVRRTNYI